MGKLRLFLLIVAMRLPSFNVAKSSFCTCLPKYNINPYLGRCAHQCIYCYAVKFPSFTSPTIPRFKLKEDIVKMVKGTKARLPVMFSDSTDPYQPLEKKYEITRRCLEVLAQHGFPLLIVTKSSLVERDIDIFKKTRTVVSMSITTLREDVATLIEPYASPPKLRVESLQRIAEEDIPTVIRIDPIIPTITSNREELESIISKAAEIGVKQITASTMKQVRGLFSSLRTRNPELFSKLTKIYAEGKWHSGYKYLNKEERLKILESLRATTLKYGLKFATCREGFPYLNSTICDGTVFCREHLNRTF